MRDPNDAPAEMSTAVAELVLAHRVGRQIRVQKSQKFELRFVKVGREELAASEFNFLPTRYIRSGDQGRNKKDIEGMIKQVEMRIAELSKQLASRRNSIQSGRTE